MRAALSNASPAASSRVWPRTSWPRWSRTAVKQGVPAAGKETEERRLQRLGLEEVGGDVALKVVDRDQRQPPRRGDRLRGADPDQEGADQPGTGGDRHRLDLVERGARLLEGGLNYRRGQLQVVAGGDLRHDAPEPRMGSGLGGDHIGKDARAVEDGGAGVVAGGLDCEDQGS